MKYAYESMFPKNKQRFAIKCSFLFAGPVPHSVKSPKLAPSMPRIMVVPATIDDETVGDAAKFRMGGRLPTVCYLHARNQVRTYQKYRRELWD